MALTEGRNTGEFILTTSRGKISYDTVEVIVPATTTYPPGHVLGKLAASGNYVEYDNAGTDGSETAAGILYGELDNPSGAPVNMDGVVINWGAEVRGADLSYFTGATQPDIDAAIADLAAVGVKVRS